MSLPAPDVEFLERRGFVHEVIVDGNMTCVVLKNWMLPQGMSHELADLLIRLQPGYPDLPPDMWWFDPGLTLVNGTIIQATEHAENYLGRSWQRWSRHFNPGQWRSGVDGLESYVALIDRELSRSVASAA
jgi:Prokaryotic E2 family E